MPNVSFDEISVDLNFPTVRGIVKPIATIGPIDGKEKFCVQHAHDLIRIVIILQPQLEHTIIDAIRHHLHLQKREEPGLRQ